MKLFEKDTYYYKLKYCCEYCAYNSEFFWGAGERNNNKNKNYYCLYFHPKRKIKRDFKDRVWEMGFGASLSDEAFPEWCPLEEAKDGKNT